MTQGKREKWELIKSRGVYQQMTDNGAHGTGLVIYCLFCSPWTTIPTPFIRSLQTTIEMRFTESVLGRKLVCTWLSPRMGKSVESDGMRMVEATIEN